MLRAQKSKMTVFLFVKRRKGRGARVARRLECVLGAHESEEGRALFRGQGGTSVHVARDLPTTEPVKVGVPSRSCRVIEVGAARPDRERVIGARKVKGHVEVGHVPLDDFLRGEVHNVEDGRALVLRRLRHWTEAMTALILL